MAESIDSVCNEIYRLINSEPGISDPTHVSISVKKVGLFKKELHLVGRVGNDLEKKRVDEIIKNNSHGFTIVDELRVKG